MFTLLAKTNALFHIYIFLEDALRKIIRLKFRGIIIHVVGQILKKKKQFLYERCVRHSNKKQMGYYIFDLRIVEKLWNLSFTFVLLTKNNSSFHIFRNLNDALKIVNPAKTRWPKIQKSGQRLKRKLFTYEACGQLRMIKQMDYDVSEVCILGT